MDVEAGPVVSRYRLLLERAKLAQGMRALGTTWVYTCKTDAAGNVIRHKARLVAQGFAQQPGICCDPGESEVFRRQGLVLT